jgi:hypothetical protein
VTSSSRIQMSKKNISEICILGHLGSRRLGHHIASKRRNTGYPIIKRGIQKKGNPQVNSTFCDVKMASVV